MKNFLVMFFAALLIGVITVQAQIPKKISYQGVLTTSSGQPAPAGDYGMVFSFHDSLTGGVQLWSETHSAVTVEGGTFKVFLGSVTPFNLSFDRAIFLQMTVTTGPNISSPVTFPRSEFTSAPYALRADTAEVALSSSLAIRALSADSASNVKQGGAVTGINNLKDNVTLSAGSNVTITPNGNTLTIAATGGSGSPTLPFPDTVTSTTAPLSVVQRGTGGGASVEINNASNPSNAVTVTSDGGGGTVVATMTGEGNGGFFRINNTENIHQALWALSNGLGTTFSSYNQGGGGAGYFTASSPYVLQALGTGSGPAVNGISNGTGIAGQFLINSSINSNPAIDVLTSGSSNAGRFEISNASNSSATVNGTTNGLGNAGRFEINNAGNTSDALRAITNGSGPAFSTYSSGTGGGIVMQIDNPSSNARGLSLSTNGGNDLLDSYNTGTGRAGNFTINNPSSSSDVLEVTGVGTGRVAEFYGQGPLTDGVLINTNGNFNRPQLTLYENADYYSTLKMRNNQTNKYWTMAGYPNEDDATSTLDFIYQGSGSSKTVLHINGSGKVGIGVSPVSQFHVGSTTNPSVFTLGYNATSGGYTALLTSLSSVSGGYASLQSVKSAGSSYGDLVLNKDGGNVGIGLESPVAKLDVLVNDGNSQDAIKGRSNGGGSGIYGLTTSSSGSGVSAEATSPTGTALTINSGAIKVHGAGFNTNTAVFVQSGANVSASTQVTMIDNPICNGDPNAILIVTEIVNYSDNGSGFVELTGTGGILTMPAFYVYYSSANYGPNGLGTLPSTYGHWVIRCAVDADYPSGTSVVGRSWSVMVVKP